MLLIPWGGRGVSFFTPTHSPPPHTAAMYPALISSVKQRFFSINSATCWCLISFAFFFLHKSMLWRNIARREREKRSFMGVYDLVVDRVTRKLRDLDSSGLKAVKLIVKHSDAARRGTVGEPANYLLFQDVCQGTGFGPAARILALNPKTAIIFSLQRVLSCIHIFFFFFPKTQMEKSELLRFWLCLFRCHLRRCDFSLLIITDCGATNTSPVLSFMTEGRGRKNCLKRIQGGGEMKQSKKSPTPRDKFDMKLCEVAFHSLNKEVFFLGGGGGISIDCQISAGESGGYRLVLLPEAEMNPPLVSLLISPRLTCPVFLSDSFGS